MRKIALMALLAAVAGCAAGPKPDSAGNFATASAAIDSKMADGAAKKLATLYPPALTRFGLQHAADDHFGTSFVTTLREQGYALQENKPMSNPDADDRAASRELSWVFDQPAETGLYRVTITIDTQSLSRVYLAKDGSVAPAGYWVRKE
jgi:hypothetical protein